MKGSTSIKKSDFDSIIQLIDKARNRAFKKVNEELILLYFNVGKIVTLKVENGFWGEGTVDELANYIALKMPGLSGFNRRGLYRMKQFYETYSITQFVLPLATELETYFGRSTSLTQVSAVPTLSHVTRAKGKKVSALPTQLNGYTEVQEKLITGILAKVTWSNHLEILSQTKAAEEKFFYLVHCIKKYWPANCINWWHSYQKKKLINDFKRRGIF